MTRFSANLGFLWQDRSLPEAIHAAARAGFDAVECHWPYDTDPDRVAAALRQTGLKMLGLNTLRGAPDKGDNGLSAVPGREVEARAAIDAALDYAAAIGAANVHVMAGRAEGQAAAACFLENLRHAVARASGTGIGILIEPLNTRDAPGYFLQTTGQARRIIETLGSPGVRLMFDCYHIQIMEGDICRRIGGCLDIIGHIQFASVPERGAPDEGELNYTHIFRHIADLGYSAPLGAEYKPRGGDTDASLGWLKAFRESRRGP